LCDEYLLACGKYIELNPVQVKIVEDPKDYEYSSYNYYAHGKESAIIDSSPISEEMGQDKVSRHQYYSDLMFDTYNIDLNKRIIGTGNYGDTVLNSLTK